MGILKQLSLKKEILIDFFDWDELEDFEERYSEIEKVIGKVHNDDIEGFDTSIYIVINGKEKFFLEYELKYETIKNAKYIINEEMLEHFQEFIANPRNLPKGKEVFVDRSVNHNRILNPLVAKDIDKARIRECKLENRRNNNK